MSANTNPTATDKTNAATWTPRRRDYVAKNGTPEERAALRAYDESRVEITPEVADYQRRLADLDKPRPAADPERVLQAQVEYCRGRIRQGVTFGQEIAPDHVLASKRLLWENYQEIVKRTRPDGVRITEGDELSQVLSAATYWLLGIDAPKGVNGWHPRRSLYIFGPPDSAKSTLAKALHHTSDRLHKVYGIGFPLGYQTLTTLVTDIDEAKGLEPLRKVSRNSMVLDELRDELVEVQHYGNYLNVLEQIIRSRYESWDAGQSQTVITTNMDPDRLNELVGSDYISSRLRDQYQLVRMESKSYRDTEAPVWTAK